MVPRVRTYAIVALTATLALALGAALLASRDTSTSPHVPPSHAEATASVPASASADTENEPGTPPTNAVPETGSTVRSPDDPPPPAPVADSTVLALVTRVEMSGSRVEIIVDPIEMYPRDESAPPAPDDPSANVVYNDKKESVRYGVSPGAIITQGAQQQSTSTVSEWARTAVSDSHAYWLDILSGDVIRIREQPIP